MKYTKAQRHKIYQQALSDILYKQQEFEGTACIAYSICFSIGFVETISIYSVTEEKFPEFYLFKPLYNINLSGYWWDTYDWEIRATVLLFCIQMTKP